jgi:hypothetical protein
VRQLPEATGSSKSENNDMEAGQQAAEREADADFARVTAHYGWSLFPRVFPRLDPSADTRCTSPDCAHSYALTTRTAVFEAGQSYWVKEPGHEMRLGAHATRVGPSVATIETTGDVTIQPRDELHETVDQVRATAYLAASGGSVRAQSSDHALAGISGAGRFALDRVPVFGELRLEGAALTGFDLMRTASFGGAAGFQLPNALVGPVVFGEAGVVKAWQGDNGETANGGYLGVGAGAELWLTRWFAFADIRRRWYRFDDWSSVPAGKTNDQTWISTTVQVGFGSRF